MTDTNELIAHRFMRRPGATLVSYRPVGIPFYRLKLRAIVLDRKRLGSMSEFALRAVATGILNPGEIGELLGLGRSATDPVVGQLIAEQQLAIGSLIGVPPLELRLTAKGKFTLEELGTVQPQEVPVYVDYDALLKRTVGSNQDLITPESLALSGGMELRPALGAPPAADDIDRHIVREILRRGRDVGGAQKRELLGFEPLEARQRFKLFQPALLLSYRRDGGGPIEFSFVIKDRIQPEYEKAFAATRQHKRILDEIVASPTVEESVKGVLGEKILERARQSRASQVQVEDLEVVSQMPPAEAAAPPVIDEALPSIDADDVRYLETFEHPPILQAALKTAATTLLIVAPWIRMSVVNETFISQLTERLAGGARVVIAWGMDPATRASDADAWALRQLEKLEAKHKNFTLKWLGNTHAKVLICDERFAAIGSFNWLSFRGDPGRPFRDERSVLIAHRATVRKFFGIEMKRLDLS